MQQSAAYRNQNRFQEAFMNRNHGQGSGKQFEGDAHREGQAGVTNGRRDRIPRGIPTKSYRASMEEAERRLREWESTLD
jgi:hypothetical protein